MTSIARKLLLSASTNVWLREHATRTAFVRRAVSRFMPGETATDALAAAARLRHAGISVILTHLGENLSTVAAAEEETQHYLRVLDDIHTSGLDAHISVKLTQLGLDVNSELCVRHVQQLLDRAEGRTFVWIDMENAHYVDRTLDVLQRARVASRDVGVALQAYLHRTASDVETLSSGGTAIRLVKGAYLESARISYARKADVDDNYYRLACRVLEARSGAVLHIATHDAMLIDRLNTFVRDHSILPAAYEYAMLYGVQERLQRQLVAAGQRVRVLISYGEQWFPWYMRRLAERPANVWFVMKNIVGG